MVFVLVLQSHQSVIWWEILLLHSGIFDSRVNGVWQQCIKTLQFRFAQNEQACGYGSPEGACLGFFVCNMLPQSSYHKESQLANSRLPFMHLLKYFVPQTDQMMEEHFTKIELAYTTIPFHILNVIDYDSFYDIGSVEIVTPKKLPSKHVATQKGKSLSLKTNLKDNWMRSRSCSDMRMFQVIEVQEKCKG